MHGTLGSRWGIKGFCSATHWLSLLLNSSGTRKKRGKTSEIGQDGDGIGGGTPQQERSVEADGKKTPGCRFSQGGDAELKPTVEKKGDLGLLD